MRVTLALGLVLAAFTLVPGAAGLVPACLPSCEVPSQTTAGFLPPVTFVNAGGTVTWTSIGDPHTASHLPDLCLHVAYTVARPASATFTVEDARLFVRSGTGEPEECVSAVPTPDGGFVLDYECLLHPNTMKGILLVK